MTHCPNCGKEVNKPKRSITNYCFTIKMFECGKCHHSFKVTINQVKLQRQPVMAA